LKFGGKSLAEPEHLHAVARQVIRSKASGEDPVVVVSAMGDTTDHFLKLAYQITDHPGARELDMLLSVGERISIALLAMAINAEGPYEAVSLTGSQVGIITDTNHTQAKILEIRCGRIQQILEKGHIPIIAGFQGVSTEKEITTLGRGGSDTTAVALAAALGAHQVRVMKDVDGIYTGDPREVPDARVIDKLAFDQMLEFSASGSKVLATDAVDLARHHNIEVAIASADTGAVGTIVTTGDFSGHGVQGLVAKRGLIAIKLARRSDLLSALADCRAAGLSISGLHSEATRPVMLTGGTTSESIRLVDHLLKTTDWGKRASKYKRLYARVSVIGSGLEPGGKHFTRLLTRLEEGHVLPRWYCCSPIRVSFCVPDGRVGDILCHLHSGLIEPEPGR